MRVSQILPYPSRGSSPSGFTLLELMVVIAVIAILATIAIPAFQDLIKTNRVASQTNELVALVTLARSEAVRRSTTVPMSFTIDGTGWEAKVLDPYSNNALRTTSGARVSLKPSQTRLIFNSRGYLASSIENEDGDWVDDPDEWNSAGARLALEHENPSTDRHRRCLRILPSGQINVELEQCD